MIYKIILIGPQGCGKGTQAERLSKRFNIPAFGMGQLLRDEIHSDSDLGRSIKAVIDAGDLVSDDLVTNVLKARLSKQDVQDGYILDGYPRNLHQFGMFSFDTPTHVIVLDIPIEESLKRLSGRLTCIVCGKVFSDKDGYSVDDICSCGSKLYQRDDDKPEAIRRRLDIYKNETEPILDAYEERNLLYKVDGVGTVDEVYNRIIKSIER